MPNKKTHIKEDVKEDATNLLTSTNTPSSLSPLFQVSWVLSPLSQMMPITPMTPMTPMTPLTPLSPLSQSFGMSDYRSWRYAGGSSPFMNSYRSGFWNQSEPNEYLL
jgi:hypothetical protein